MKKIKSLGNATKFAGLLLILLAFTSCSKYVKKEDVKIENIDLTITPNDWVWNSTYNTWEYFVSHEYTNNDALVGYVMTGQGEQVLPYLDGSDGTICGLVDETFNGRIRITYYDGTSNLARPTYNKNVYLKIIPSSLIKPNINMKDFKAVQKAYDL